MQSKTLLVTGFMPFDKNAVNPSWEAVSRLPASVGAYRIETLLLPVEFERASALAIEKAQALRADAVLCVGLAASRNAITPEALGVNVRDARIPDNAGFQPNGEPIQADAPAAYFSTLPVRRMVDAIRAVGLPAALSYSAGTYVCNDLLYSLLHRFDGSETRVAFIHVPTLSDTLTLDSFVRALCAAIEAI